MMLANYIGAVALVVIGFYAMVMKHDIIKIVVGMGLVDYGLNLMIVSVGFNEGGTAPIFTFGELNKRHVLRRPHPPGADADEHSHRRLRHGHGPRALRAHLQGIRHARRA